MKYRFEIYYANKNMQAVSNLMCRLDLGMEAIVTRHDIIFTAQNDIPIEKLKETITEGYESQGCKVYSIEGGKIE